MDELERETKRYELLMLKSSLERECAMEDLKAKYLISGSAHEQMDQVLVKIDGLEDGIDPVPAVEEPIIEEPTIEETPEETPDPETPAVEVPVPDEEPAPESAP